jgi:hypothetical protein
MFPPERYAYAEAIFILAGPTGFYTGPTCELGKEKHSEAVIPSMEIHVVGSSRMS